MLRWEYRPNVADVASTLWQQRMLLGHRFCFVLFFVRNGDNFGYLRGNEACIRSFR